MKDNKTDKITVRFTPEEKQALKEYAEKVDKTLSEVIRGFLYEVLTIKEGE